MHADITPVSYRSGQGTKLIINGAHVSVYKSASVDWKIVDATGLVLETGLTTMIKSEYDLWGSEDDYIFNWLAGKLGLTITQIVEDVYNPVFIPQV